MNTATTVGHADDDDHGASETCRNTAQADVENCTDFPRRAHAFSSAYEQRVDDAQSHRAPCRKCRTQYGQQDGIPEPDQQRDLDIGAVPT